MQCKSVFILILQRKIPGPRPPLSLVADVVFQLLGGGLVRGVGVVVQRSLVELGRRVVGGVRDDAVVGLLARDDRRRRLVQAVLGEGRGRVFIQHRLPVQRALVALVGSVRVQRVAVLVHRVHRIPVLDWNI